MDLIRVFVRRGYDRYLPQAGKLKDDVDRLAPQQREMVAFKAVSM